MQNLIFFSIILSLWSTSSWSWSCRHNFNRQDINIPAPPSIDIDGNRIIISSIYRYIYLLLGNNTISLGLTWTSLHRTKQRIRWITLKHIHYGIDVVELEVWICCGMETNVHCSIRIRVRKCVLNITIHRRASFVFISMKVLVHQDNSLFPTTKLPFRVLKSCRIRAAIFLMNEHTTKTRH